jgi:hypothetical protein
VHLLAHLLVALALLLCRALCPDGLDSSLLHSQLDCFRQSCLSPRTCRSASFSSFSSFSFALTAASALRSSVRLSHDVRFARGRKGPLLSCHCLPGRGVSLRCVAVRRSGGLHTVLLHALYDGGRRGHRGLCFDFCRHVCGGAGRSDGRWLSSRTRPAKEKLPGIDKSTALGRIGRHPPRGCVWSPTDRPSWNHQI